MTRRTRSFHHYTVGGELSVEEVHTSLALTSEMAGGGLSADSKIAATNIQPAAVSAAAFDMLFLLFEFFEQRIGEVGPDFGKRSLAHVAETEMAPELIRMNLAVPADTADTPPGVVAFIPLQQLHDVFGALRVFFAQP